MTYTMIVKTQSINAAGRPTSSTERIPHLMEGELDARREAARRSAPRGATRTIKVVSYT